MLPRIALRYGEAGALTAVRVPAVHCIRRWGRRVSRQGTARDSRAWAACAAAVAAYNVQEGAWRVGWTPRDALGA